MRKAFSTLVINSVALLVCSGCARAQTVDAGRGPGATVRSGSSTPAAAAQPRGYTGFTILISATAGAGRGVVEDYPVIHGIHPGSPAQKAGLAAGDVILEIGGRDPREYGAMRVQPGGRYTYRIRRGREEREFTLVAIARPASAERPQP